MTEIFHSIQRKDARLRAKIRKYSSRSTLILIEVTWNLRDRNFAYSFFLKDGKKLISQTPE